MTQGDIKTTFWTTLNWRRDGFCSKSIRWMFTSPTEPEQIWWDRIETPRGSTAGATFERRYSPARASGRPLQAEQGYTLHRYSIGCSLSHTQSQCLEGNRRRKEKSLHFLPVSLEWSIIVGPYYKQNHSCKKKKKAFRWGHRVSHVSAHRALARGQGSQCNDKRSGTWPSSELFLPLADLLLVPSSEAAHEACEAFLLRRQPTEPSFHNWKPFVMCYFYNPMRIRAPFQNQPRGTTMRELNTRAPKVSPGSYCWNPISELVFLTQQSHDLNSNVASFERLCREEDTPWHDVNMENSPHARRCICPQTCRSCSDYRLDNLPRLPVCTARGSVLLYSPLQHKWSEEEQKTSSVPPKQKLLRPNVEFAGGSSQPRQVWHND